MWIESQAVWRHRDSKLESASMSKMWFDSPVTAVLMGSNNSFKPNPQQGGD